jgi:DNA repair exonuclease SbcCD nuclease subunit
MGKNFRFIHCADLHLGSRFKGLDTEDPALARKMRESVMDSFRRIVDAAISNSVDALVISGDIYDDSNELPSTRMWFSEQLSRLDVPVYICRGNHDSRTSWDGAIPYPGNVHEFAPEMERFQIADGVEIVGISFYTPHESRNLVSMLDGTPGMFTIAAVHCDIDSFSEGYRYAPCSLSDFKGRGVDYWALGHIHRREVVSTSPYIVYPGNIQGRSFKETGEKGAYLVTVEDRRVSSLEFIPTQTYAWADITVDINGKGLGEVVNFIRGKATKDSLCRLTFRGSGIMDAMLRTKTEDVKQAIVNSTGCIISSFRIETTPEIDIETRMEDRDMGGAILRCGRRMESLSKEELIEIICQNRIASRFRDSYNAMDEEEIRALVREAMSSVTAKMGAMR